MPVGFGALPVHLLGYVMCVLWCVCCVVCAHVQTLGTVSETCDL